MGQAANSNRNASLDQKKRRAAGRGQSQPERRAILDAIDQDFKGQVGGASGKQGRANRGTPGNILGEGGGGGGATAGGRTQDTGRSTKRTRKNNA